MLFFHRLRGKTVSQKLHKHFVYCFQQKTGILQCISSIKIKYKGGNDDEKLIITLFIAMLALAGCNTNKEEPKRTET